jgi:beta-phosphoglucomutase
MTRGFIFDMDGTMVDNMMVHHRAWQRKLATLGLELSLEEVRQQIHGINEEIIERLFGHRFSPAERTQLAYDKEAAYREIFLPDLRLIDGLDDFLKQAMQLNIPMGIGTAAPPENVQFVLNNLHLHPYFRVVIDATQVHKGKPDPEVFLRVADLLGLAATECIVFEDSPTGSEAARRAGMQAVIITSTHQAAEFEHQSHIIRFIPDFEHISPKELLS